MVTIIISRDSKGRIGAFRVEGHAGYGSRGNDIVCAGVSALTQAAVIGLEDYLGLQPQVLIEPGLLECYLDDKPMEQGAKIEAILETMLLGLRSMAAQYPDRVCIIEEEVA